MDNAVLNLIPFLRLNKLLKMAFLPVYPRSEFRAWLGEQLLLEAVHMQTQRQAAAVVLDTALRPGRREIIIGAALGSAVSLAGIIALLVHLRTVSSRQDEAPAA